MKIGQCRFISGARYTILVGMGRAGEAGRPGSYGEGLLENSDYRLAITFSSLIHFELIFVKIDFLQDNGLVSFFCI